MSSYVTVLEGSASRAACVVMVYCICVEAMGALTRKLAEFIVERIVFGHWISVLDPPKTAHSVVAALTHVASCVVLVDGWLDSP